jgi:hypothetical protein
MRQRRVLALWRWWGAVRSSALDSKHNGSDGEHPEVVDGPSVVAGGDTPESLELVDKTLH